LSAVLDKALSLNSSGRFQTAKEFREALRSVGRSELRSSDHPADRSDASRMTASSALDPFDAYSILKPDDMPWATPRRSWSIPTIICGAGVLVVLAFIGSSFVSSAPEADRTITDAVKAAATRNPGLNTNARDPRSERPRPAASVSSSPAPAHDSNHGNEKTRRADKRAMTGPADPPTPSLRPALRLPSY
jgi:hypothetical protein